MKTETTESMLRRGGEWLGGARSWMQHRAINGDSAIWGSDEALRFPGDITVKELERFAANVAAMAINEERSREARGMGWLSQALNEGNGTYKP